MRSCNKAALVLTGAEAGRDVPLTLVRCRYNPSAEETNQFWIAQGYSEPALDDPALVAKENSGKPSGLRRWYTDTPCWRKTSAQSHQRTSALHSCSKMIGNLSNGINDQGCDNAGAVPVVCQECSSAETKVERIPIGQWFCSKCANLEAEQRGVPHTIPSAVKIGDPNFKSSGLQRRFESWLESPSGGRLSRKTSRHHSSMVARLISGHRQLEHVGLIVGTALWSSSDNTNDAKLLDLVRATHAKLRDAVAAFRWFQKFMGSNPRPDKRVGTGNIERVGKDEARAQACVVTSDMVSTDAVTGFGSGNLLNEAPNQAANASSATELHDNERAHRQAQLMAVDQREAIECQEKDEDSDDIAPQRAEECNVEADSTNLGIGDKMQDRKAHAHWTAANDFVGSTEAAREPEDTAGPKSQLLKMSRYALEAHARAEPFGIDYNLMNKLPATKEGRATIVQMILSKQAEIDKQQDQQQDQQQQQQQQQQQRTSAPGECDAVCSPAKVAKNSRKRKSGSEGIIEGGKLRQGNSETQLHAFARSRVPRHHV